MKRGLWVGVSVLAIMVVYMGPGTVWAEDTSSRIYQLESRIEALESQVQESTGYVSVSFMTGWERYGPGTTIMVENMWTIDQQYQFANADTSLCWEGRTATSWDPADRAGIYLPIQLPQGATITEFQLVYYDERDDEIGIKGTLRRSISTGVDFAFVFLKSTGISYTPQVVSTTSIDPEFAVVDNSLYSYSIRANFYGGTDVVAISAIVKYELP